MGLGREEEFSIALLFVHFVEFRFPDTKGREAAMCGKGKKKKGKDEKVSID